MTVESGRQKLKIGKDNKRIRRFSKPPNSLFLTNLLSRLLNRF